MSKQAKDEGVILDLTQPEINNRPPHPTAEEEVGQTRQSTISQEEEARFETSGFAAEEAGGPKQPDLDGMTGPGVEKPSIPEIDSAAKYYMFFRDKRVALSAEEVAAKGKLIWLLHVHEGKLGRAPDGSIRYEYDGHLVELFPTKEKLRVRVLEEEEPDEVHVSRFQEQE